MALNRLQSLVSNVTTTVEGNVTGLESKTGAMRDFMVSLSYPRLDSPQYPMADTVTRLGLGSAKHRGTAHAVARTGRSGCWSNPCRPFAINSRGAILSGWSWPLTARAQA
jgi:hypothetical protein